MLIALTRPVSPSLANCELQHLERQEIDVAEASAQHEAYRRCLADLGARLISAPAEPDLPDAVFVEDPAVVLDEVAVMTRMWSPVRRKESDSLAGVLAAHRPLRHLREPATLEGGDLVRIGKRLFVGLSRRTNREGVRQLAGELDPFGYTVEPVAMHGCLHLKSACCYLGGDTLLANRAWIDPEPFHGCRILDVPPGEPHAANALAIGGSVIVSSAFPATAALLEKEGWRVRQVDNSELRKAEAGVTCSSILFDSPA